MAAAKAVSQVPKGSSGNVGQCHGPSAPSVAAQRQPLRLPAVAAGRPSVAAQRLSSPAVAAGRQEPNEPATFSRAQLLKGGLAAAGGLLLGTAVPLQGAAAREAVAASTAATAVASAGGAALSPAADSFSRVLLSTLADCQLAVSVYPTFSYNAAGGGGSGTVRQGPDDLLHITFDPATLNIPPINHSHASIIGIPVPPPLNIAIVPQRLEGTLDPWTGRVELDFLASFEFTAGPLYRAAPLTVATTLTTEASRGALRSGQGSRMLADGRARLVGVARVPPTDDPLLNTFLMLPTDALAVLSAELTFS